MLQCSRWLQENSYAQPAGTADVLACQLLQLHRCRTFYQLCKVRDKDVIPVLTGRPAHRPSNASGPASACAAHCAPCHLLTTTLQSHKQELLALQLLAAPGPVACTSALHLLPPKTFIGALQILHLMPGWPVGLWTSDQPDTFGRLMQVKHRPELSQPGSILLLESLQLPAPTPHCCRSSCCLEAWLLWSLAASPGGCPSAGTGSASTPRRGSSFRCTAVAEAQSPHVQQIRACATLPFYDHA